MLDAQALDEISLNAIAREANISKASVYRYFESREELFLHLMLEASERWCGMLIRRLQRLAGTGDAAGVAAAIASTTTEHEVFARLASVLSTVLERNVSVDVVAHFKLSIMEMMGAVLMAVQHALPELSLPDVRHLIECSYFQLVGMWPAAHPSAAVEEALKRPELADACIDFEASLERSIVVTIAGLRACAGAADCPPEQAQRR